MRRAYATATPLRSGSDKSRLDTAQQRGKQKRSRRRRRRIRRSIGDSTSGISPQQDGHRGHAQEYPLQPPSRREKVADRAIPSTLSGTVSFMRSGPRHLLAPLVPVHGFIRPPHQFLQAFIRRMVERHDSRHSGSADTSSQPPRCAVPPSSSDASPPVQCPPC